MGTREIATSLLKADEGLKLKVYKDSLGFNTIGYGFCLDKDFTEEDAIYFLQSRIDSAIEFLTDTYPWFLRLNPNRQAACVDMVYQLGKLGFSKFVATIALLGSEDYEKASQQMLKSTWASQTPNRAKRISEIIRTGVINL